ncbi:hypothetical protein KVR01_006266 [Diaporthe batatas]|uniref:uncharacterized protein n=1 Tax=Diaporthe batatas TaxID=748121 RepID=UPI001D03D454|nr:uncharacterized protein KVR01_006266 [Diaporthe batatas]KAG8164348.1 hypothetical protein KVR01_006266 [Diaporthe batatas]
MAEKNPSGEQNFPPPPPGPPPGHNGLAMNPSDHPAPDSNSELYDNTPPTHSDAQFQAQHQTQQQQQTAHQVPPPDSDGAPKKVGWGQRFSAWGGKAATPFNMLANKLGSESFLPDTMDKECEKAARILRSFCKDGIYTDAQAPETVEAPTTDADGKPTTAAAKPKKNRTLLTIPSKVINRAVGLAIFTTARAGFHVSGATGSGVIIARLPDGSWSPPSGIQVHSVGAGFMVGLDIYDCIVVINTREALEAFTKTRMSLGSDLAVVAGPWGAGGSVDFAAPQSQKGKAKAGDAPGSPDPTTKDAEGKPATPPPAASEKHPDGAEPVPTVNEPTADKTTAEAAERPQAGKERKPSGLKQALKPTYSYVKSRGFYAGVQVDGTIVTERKDANTAFYGEPVGVQSILKGEAPLVPGKENWVNIVKPLFDTIKGAEGWRAQGGTQQGQQWANQQGPSDTYGHGNAPQGYPTGFDPVFSGAGENPPAKPPRPGVSGVTEGVHGLGLGGSSPAGPPPHADTQTPAARSKAAEAAAEAEAAREQERRERQELEQETAQAVAGGAARPLSMAPPYTESAGPAEASHGEAGGEQPPPAYTDDGVARPGVGDTKHPGGPPS